MRLLTSTDKSVSVALSKQIDLVTEFMKVMSLAHECIPETVTIKGVDHVIY